MLKFIFEGNSESGLTKRWTVRSQTEAGPFLGWIQFHSPWRRYVFYPHQGTLYDASCLGEIANFLNDQTFSRRVEKKKTSPIGTGADGIGTPDMP